MRFPRTAALIAVVLAGLLLVAACGDDEASSEPATDGDPSGETFTTPTGITCSTETPATTGNGTTYDAPPELTIDESTTYVATMSTSCGDIVLELDAEGAPITVNNFVFLANEGFYDGLTFHRAVEGFVIQGGDPTGTGAGGPGYQFEDELPDDGYPQGSLAMANAGPSTNGSQFFIVTGQADLPNAFSKFGRVTQGLEVAQAIESLALPDQTLSQPVYIGSVTIAES
jgi:cyclophilin family peptidyl-prolyl cis-trans isomerase